MFGLGAPELFLILVIALVVIGPKRLPEVAKTLGKGYKDLKKAVDGVKGSVNVNEVLSGIMKDETEHTPDNKEERTPLKREDDRELMG